MACHICGLVQRLPDELKALEARCVRCDTLIHRHVPNSRARTMAFALAALVLYIPANLYPVMTMDTMGRHSENTVWAGVVSLCQEGMWFVGGVVFVASILVPVLKLLGLFFLALNGGRYWPRAGSWIFKAISRIGPWAMLDVFLLAVAVALIKFGKFGRVAAGPGIIAFTAVVVLTILASSSFDPRLIWNEDAV
jgi:paraquat-inducible protein A